MMPGTQTSLEITPETQRKHRSEIWAPQESFQEYSYNEEATVYVPVEDNVLDKEGGKAEELSQHPLPHIKAANGQVGQVSVLEGISVLGVQKDS